MVNVTKASPHKKDTVSASALWRYMEHGSWIGALVAGLAGLLQLSLLLYIFSQRLTYPLDLEWEEGGMLCHALRLLQGQSIYGPPSADFISFLYTPFYPFMLALLGKIFGLSYILGRLVSLLSFLCTVALVVLAVWRQAGRGWIGAAWGIAAAGLMASAFPHVAAWFDLVRNDSLFMALVTGGLYLLYFHHRKHLAWIIVAGILMGLSFLTKQTGSLFILYSGAALLLLNWRRLPLYVLSVGLVAGGTVLALNHTTDGWFWRIIFQMHQQHDFFPDRIWPHTELALFRASPVVAVICGLWLLVKLVEWIGLRRWQPRDKGLLYWLSVAMAGVLVSAVGFATQWAVENAFIPGLLFSAAFAVMACSDLTDLAQGGWRRRLGGPLSLLLGGALATQLVLQLYSPRPHIPTPADRGAAQQLLASLKKRPGSLLMPYHPWYPHLVGKQTSYHQMSTNDIVRAGLPLPADLLRRVTTQQYNTIIFDNSPLTNHNAFMLAYYKVGDLWPAETMPRVFTGFQVRPRFLLVPKRKEPVPPGAKRIFGFEDGTYQGWEQTDQAFGTRPIGGKSGPYVLAGPYEGSYLAGSYFGGDVLIGTLLSPEFVVDRPILTYRIGGGQDTERLFVRLLVDRQEVHRGTGRNSHLMEERRVDVSAYGGRSMQVELVDASQGAWGHLLFDDLQLREH